MMTARGDAEPDPDAARKRSTSGKVSPARPSAPTRRKSRRFPPWSVSTSAPHFAEDGGARQVYHADGRPFIIDSDWEITAS